MKRLRLFMSICIAICFFPTSSEAALKCPWSRQFVIGMQAVCPPEASSTPRSAGMFYSKKVNNLFEPPAIEDECPYAFDKPVTTGTRVYPGVEYKREVQGKTVLNIPTMPAADLTAELNANALQTVRLESYTVEFERLPPRVDRTLIKACDNQLFTERGAKRNPLIPLRLITEAEFVKTFNYRLTFKNRFEGNAQAVLTTLQANNPQAKVEGTVTSEGDMVLRISSDNSRFLLGYRAAVINSRLTYWDADRFHVRLQDESCHSDYGRHIALAPGR